MKKYLFLILLFSSNIALAEPLAAIMTYESMVITSEGVQKQTQFKERFIRDKNVVWSERIIPGKAHHHHENNQESKEEHVHKHNLNFATAGKWLQRNDKNEIIFRFVRAEDKKIVEPRTSEYGTLGFDGDWDAAYYVVNPNMLKKMQPLKKTAPVGTKWYETKDATQFTRILWNEQKEIPLVIESGKNDGTTSNKITLNLTPVPKNLPWNLLAQYQTIAYEDLLD